MKYNECACSEFKVMHSDNTGDDPRTLSDNETKRMNVAFKTTMLHVTDWVCLTTINTEKQSNPESSRQPLPPIIYLPSPNPAYLLDIPPGTSSLYNV